MNQPDNQASTKNSQKTAAQDNWHNPIIFKVNKVIRPFLLLSSILHALLLLIPLPRQVAPEFSPEPIATEKNIQVTQLPPPQPSPSLSPSLSPSPKLFTQPQTPIIEPQTSKPTPQPPTKSKPQPSPKPTQVVPPKAEIPQQQPEKIEEPEPLVSPQKAEEPEEIEEPEPLVSPQEPEEPETSGEADSVIPPQEPEEPEEIEEPPISPFASVNFPVYQNAESGCFGSDTCNQVSGVSGFRSLSRNLQEHLEENNYTVVLQEDLGDTGVEIFEVSKDGETQYLSVLDIGTLGTAIYVLAPTPITSLEELEQAE